MLLFPLTRHVLPGSTGPEVTARRRLAVTVEEQAYTE